MVLNERYNVVKLLGDGTFGRVLLAHDKRKDNRDVAVKVIRDVKRYMESAKVEADILKDIRDADRYGESNCAVMYDTFTHDLKFYCLVFEPLGVSLYDFLKDNAFRGCWMQDVQQIARESMQALVFLHSQLKMTHTDLKPENILFVTQQPAREAHFPREAEWRRRQASSSSSCGPYMRPVSASVKLIDFGNATYEDQHHSSIINTRQYRGPEVLLDLGWNELSDQWSIGCILMEIYVGDQLFATHEELEHLALIERIIGPLPERMMRHAGTSAREHGWVVPSPSGVPRLPWPERASSTSSQRYVAAQVPLKEQVLPHHASFADFVAELLTLETKGSRGRPSAVESMKHPFFNARFDD